MSLIKNAAVSSFVIEVNDTVLHNGSNPDTSQISKIIKGHDSEVYINGTPVRKNMDLMRLMIPNGSEVTVEAVGPDEEEVVAAIEGMLSTNRVVARKFKKKAGPFGVPGPNSAPKPPTSLPTGLEAPPPSPTPKPPTGLTEPPGAPNVPKIPDGGLPRSTESEVPTDVTVDAQSGNVTIKKGPVNIRIAEAERAFTVNIQTDDPRRLNRELYSQTLYKDENTIIETHDAVEHGDAYDESFGNELNFKGIASGNIDEQIITEAIQNYITSKGYNATVVNVSTESVYGEGEGDLRFAKKATHQDWIDFKANDNEPQYGDWEEEKEYSKEYHDNPFSAPSNRLVPPTFTVKATIPEYMNTRNIAYVLQTSTMLEVDINGDTLTIKDVASPLSLITELTSYGIEAEVTEDMTKFDQGLEDFKLGQKVALLGDYEDMNYFYNPEVPPAQAMIVGKKDSKFLLENEQWGRFQADKEELGHVR